MATITTDELFQYAAPPEILFSPNRSDPGTVTEPVAAMANDGLGSLKIGRGSPGKTGSNPRDTWSVKVLCAAAGEVNAPGVINLAGVPRFKISLDGGTTYGPELEPEDAGLSASGIPQGRITHERSGLVLLFERGLEGEAVTFGLTDARVIVTPKQHGMSMRIVSGSALGVEFDRETGLVTLTVATSTAAAAATALNESGLELSATAGGTGAGTVLVASATALPFVSFAADDEWTFTTTPSPDAVLMCAAASEAVDEALGGSLAAPYTGEGYNVKYHKAALARWRWICKLGLQGNEKVAGMKPDETLRWMRDVASGDYLPTITEGGPARNFSELIEARDPLSLESDGGSGIPI